MPATTWGTGQDAALIRTVVVSVSIRIAAITVGIAAIKSDSAFKANSASKISTMETASELMESSAAEAAATKPTEGARVETPNEAAAMESAAAPPSHRSVIGEHQRASFAVSPLRQQSSSLF